MHTLRTGTHETRHRKRSWTGISSALQHRDSPGMLDPVSITQLSETRPTLLTALGQLHNLPPLILIQQLVSHQASPSARVCILDSKMWSLAWVMTYISNIT